MTRHTRPARLQTTGVVDLSHLNAVPLKVVMPRSQGMLRIYLVGCGGTGSWAAPHIARLARFLREVRGVKTAVTFVDPDGVETRNVFRQNFCAAEVGSNKAELLASRLSAAWGIEIHTHAQRFESKMIDLEYGDVGVIVGCVDNALARREISETLSRETQRYGNGEPPPPRLWWIDSGNGEDTGQVLVGAAPSSSELRQAFPFYPQPTYCVNLPSPALQHPDLLQDSPTIPQPPTPAPDVSGRVADANTNQAAISCTEMALLGEQSPIINAMMANLAATYLWRLFADARGLTTFATYCNLSSMSWRSTYIVPAAVAEIVGKPEAWFR